MVFVFVFKQFTFLVTKNLHIVITRIGRIERTERKERRERKGGGEGYLCDVNRVC